MDAEGIGISSTMLGAGRETKESVIDFGAGIKLVKKTHDKVAKGDTIAILYTSDEKLVENCIGLFAEENLSGQREENAEQSEATE